MADGIRELIAPSSVYASPYTGLPLSRPRTGANPYPHQESPPVSWGYKTNNQILWTESQWNLEGNIMLDPPPFIIHSLDVMNVMGIGKSLSGPWWVNTVTYQIDTSQGFHLEADIMRNAFGLGNSQESSSAANTSATRPLKQSVTPKSEDVKRYMIKPGDTLWALALRFYGSGQKYTVLQKVNNIKNPNLIFAGDTLIIPASS